MCHSIISIDPAFRLCINLFEDTKVSYIFVYTQDTFLYTGYSRDWFKCGTGSGSHHCRPVIQWRCCIFEEHIVVVFINGIGQIVIIVAWIADHGSYLSGVNISNNYCSGARSKRQHSRCNLQRCELCHNKAIW